MRNLPHGLDIDIINNNARYNIPSDGVPISSNQPIFGIPGQTKQTDANLEDSACTVLVLLFFTIYLVNGQTMRKIAHIFVAFSEKLNFRR